MSDCEKCERFKQDALDWQAQAQALMRQKRRLEAELEPRKPGPQDKTIRFIFDKWVEKTGRDPKRTKLTDDRIKAVISALKNYEPGRILKAVDGAALDPYIDEKGTVHNDLTLICRGSKIEVFEKKADAPLKGLEAQVKRISKIVSQLEVEQ